MVYLIIFNKKADEKQNFINLLLSNCFSIFECICTGEDSDGNSIGCP